MYQIAITAKKKNFPFVFFFSASLIQTKNKKKDIKLKIRRTNPIIYNNNFSSTHALYVDPFAEKIFAKIRFWLLFPFFSSIWIRFFFFASCDCSNVYSCTYEIRFHCSFRFFTCYGSHGNIFSLFFFHSKWIVLFLSSTCNLIALAMFPFFFNVLNFLLISSLYAYFVFHVFFCCRCFLKPFVHYFISIFFCFAVAFLHMLNFRAAKFIQVFKSHA